MIISVKKALDADDTKAVWQFLNGFDYIPYQQFPEYRTIEGFKITSFVGKSQDIVIAWAQVVEKKNILAVLEFGPLGQTETVVQDLIVFIADYYKKRFFLLLRWVPYCYSEETYNRMAAIIAQRFSFLDTGPLIHWSSKRIALQDKPESILKNFSENHRRSIKKAATQNIVCRVLDHHEIDDFSKGFMEMYQHRKLTINKQHIATSFRRLHAYLSQSAKGFFIGAFNQDVLLGGIVIIYQGCTAFYYRGYINHAERKLPINHLVFYQAILKSKEDGMMWFDFGGYAVGTREEQLININKFKDGFRGDLISFPESRTIRLHWIAGTINRVLQLIRR